ncbi:hypothetical protein PIB30_053991 [Stylosanthes scabra]|uniref:Pentatricopeptide repeat-containing protein n=1 Tax=Stylosanthes scabra TaxID=79078 RepID=A0ABU6SJQ4_9FABA|nr:hypothetical protein [Stylosanthes scabra]
MLRSAVMTGFSRNQWHKEYVGSSNGNGRCYGCCCGVLHLDTHFGSLVMKFLVKFGKLGDAIVVFDGMLKSQKRCMQQLNDWGLCAAAPL